MGLTELASIEFKRSAFFERRILNFISTQAAATVRLGGETQVAYCLNYRIWGKMEVLRFIELDCVCMTELFPFFLKFKFAGRLSRQRNLIL